MSVEFKIGCDPEFFLRDKSTGKFVSAHGLIPGNKRAPMKVERGAVQVDGMALEFNIDPVTTVEDWNKNINTVLTQLREMIDPQLEFVFEPVAHFGKEYIDTQPNEAKELGCEPDYNAYSGEINPKPNADLGFRTASGHIHIGWTDQQDITDKEHIDACHMLVKQLDCFLALPAFAWDQDEIRQSMYGALGAYRPKHYGVEYRVLSNAWLRDVDSRKYVFNQTKYAAQQLIEGAQIYRNYNNIEFGLKGYTFENIRDLVRYNNGHHDLADFAYVSGEFNKLVDNRYERPSIKERNRKINEEMYFIHKKTGDLIAWGDVPKSLANCTHPNDYVRWCKKNGTHKPTSLNQAVELYNSSRKEARTKTYDDIWGNKIGLKKTNTLSPGTVLSLHDVIIDDLIIDYN